MTAVASKAAKRGTKGQTGPKPASSRASRFTLASPHPWIAAVLLALVTIGVYLPVHGHPFFTMDDEQYVVNNAHLRGGFAETVGWAFTTYDLANWHPVTWLSHAADVHLFQLDPAGHHDVNLLFHVINALLLLWVLQRATGKLGRSFMVAALFALHPVNVETVAWIAERKTLLSMMFFLLALGAYRWYAQKPQVGRYAVVAILYALGLMAKPQIITFPFVLLLWDYWPLERFAFRRSPALRFSLFAPRQKDAGRSGEKRIAKSEQRSSGDKRFLWLVLEKVPLFVLSLGSAVMTMRAQGQAGAMRYYPLSVRLSNAIVSYAHYIGNALWPTRLAVFYPHPELIAWRVGGSLLLLLGITALVLLRGNERYLAVGWFWFLGTLVPMIGIVQVGEQAMADRYAYVSLVGLFLMICWGLAQLAEQRRASRVWLVAPSCMVLIALAVLTHRQLSYWSNNVKLWSHMMTMTGGTYEVEENLGVALLESGQTAPAMEHFGRVTALVPASPAAIGRELAGYAAVAHLYLGANDQHTGHTAEAIAHYRKVLALAHDFTVENRGAKVPPVLIRMKAVALSNMGDAYFTLRDFPNAKSSYEAAAQLAPLTAHQWMGLGIAEQRAGDLHAAIEAYSRATRMQVSDVGFLLLAQALDESGRTQEAEAARQQARLITPDFNAAEQQVKDLVGR